MKGAKIFLLIIFILLSQINNARPTLMQWEIGFKTMNSIGGALSTDVTVYTFNSTSRNLEFYTSGTTASQFVGSGNDETNGFADVGAGGIGEMFTLGQGGTYYIRIGNKYMIISYGGGAYGDMRFSYYSGPTESMNLDYNNSGYSVSGPYTWSEKTIVLANDFGSDKTNCYGNIHLNSVTIPNVGLIGTTQKREAGTFPHTIAGEDNQNVYNYYRKWRNWSEDGITAISRSLSPADNYSYTAKYAKQVDATISKNYSYGSLYINNNEVTASQYFYDDEQYTVSASYGRASGGLLYEYDHFVYNGSNIYTTYFQINNPTSSQTISVYYNRRPDNTNLNIWFDPTINQPIVVHWNDNENLAVNSYQIWRRVKLNNVWQYPVLLTTFGRGAQTYTDNDFLRANFKEHTALQYDVRQYFSTDGTYSYPYWTDVYGLELSIVPNKDIINAQLLNEIPTSYSLTNYPNPFNPSTTINYQLPESGYVTIKVYDMLGKEIATLVNESKNAGSYNVHFDASKLTSGVYVYTITANNFIQSKKMLLVK